LAIAAFSGKCRRGYFVSTCEQSFVEFDDGTLYQIVSSSPLADVPGSSQTNPDSGADMAKVSVDKHQC
jgi:hypothetical protein